MMGEEGSVEEEKKPDWLQVLTSKVFLIHILQSCWIIILIAFFLFVPSVRLAFVGNENETIYRVVHFENMNSTETNWRAGGFLIGFCFLFLGSVVVSGVFVFRSDWKILRKKVPAVLLLLLCVTTFGLTMADISCIFKTEIILTAMCLDIVSYTSLIIYAQLSRTFPRLPYDNGVPFAPPIVLIVIGTVVASTVSYFIFGMKWYNGLISFAVGLFCLVAVVLHTWLRSDWKVLSETKPPVEWWSLTIAARIWFEGPIGVTLGSCFLCMLCVESRTY